jgi:hypothetical protein
LGRAGKEHLQLGFGIRGATILADRLEAENAQGPVRGLGQHPDQRFEDDEEPAHRRRDGERHGLRVAEGKAFRDQLADDDVQVRDDEEREAVGDDRRGDWAEELREDGLADGTDT